MDWVDETVAAFGQSMGLQHLAFNDHGVVSLTIEGTGVLNLERRDETVLLYLARSFDALASGRARRALALAHHREGHPFPLTAGLKGTDALVFLLRIPERAFSLDTLHGGLRHLERLHHDVARETN